MGWFLEELVEAAPVDGDFVGFVCDVAAAFRTGLFFEADPSATVYTLLDRHFYDRRFEQGAEFVKQCHDATYRAMGYNVINNRVNLHINSPPSTIITSQSTTYLQLTDANP